MKKYKFKNKWSFPRVKDFFQSKNKLKIYLILALLSMTVGYATLNTTLGVEGLVRLAKNNELKIYISKLQIDGVDQKSLLSSDGQTFKFTSNHIKNIGSSIIDYQVTNSSKEYDAEVGMTCSPEIHNDTTLHYDATSKVLEMGKEMDGNVTSSTEVSEKLSLYNVIKNQVKGADTTLNFSAVSSSTNGEGVYSTTNTDSGKEVYFYRGNISNNNVIFNGFCWLIIRTTETNGVKLLYNGSPNGGQCSKPSGNGIASIYYNSSSDDNAYAGYMYGTPNSSTYAATHENKNDSLLKKENDNWYEENFLGKPEAELLEDTVWCNDRSTPTDISKWTSNVGSYNQLGYGKNLTLYGFAIRGGSHISKIEPTLKCINENDKFTTNAANGNGDLKYPVGALTGDEVVYAGATGGLVASTGTSPANTNYFLYFNGQSAWTMTPNAYNINSNNYLQGVAVYNDGGLSSKWTNVAARLMGVRPTISLKEGIRVASGNGSLNTPYVIETSPEEIDTTEYTCKLNVKLIQNEEKLMGKEYCFGNECFNIIGYDRTNYTLLSKYNLLVGKQKINETNYADIPTTEEGYGLQSSRALGDKGNPIVGTIAYGQTSEYSTSTVKPHVDNYVNYLNETFSLGATGRLISLEELTKIGCAVGQQGGCSAAYNENYEWLLRTTFWTGEKDGNNKVYLVGGDGFLGSSTGITNEILRGIRPVIIVPADKVNISTRPENPNNPTSNIPEEWQDNGIFSEYYDQAYEKLQTLTLAEKIGQLMVVRYSKNTIPQDAVKNYFISGTTFYSVDFNSKTEAEVKSMISTLQTNSKIPMLMAVDEEGGKVVRVSSNSNLAPEPFKSSQELYKTGGLPLIKTDTVNKSALLRNLGLNVNFAPVVDIASSTSYIYARTLGESPEITGQYAVTVVEASKNTGVSYSLKHFPGYGNNADTHTSSSVDNTSLEELRNTHLVPFKAGIEGGAESVMISHNIVSALDKENPASLSKPVHDLLFNDLKFTGIAITDDLDMDAAKDVSNRYTKAILNGNNIILCSDYKSAASELTTSVVNGVISEDYLNQKVFKVLAWKYYKGLMSS